ncbi:MAG: hypothetical protein HY516_05060 [Candidatus Aenigmarchaeota archaeon]|nr:hypothetical protein [Candidatus Aenigmarchaeota archaeon]
MAYLGRLVGVGATHDGNPVLLYGLSGRSASSRSRIAAVHGTRVAIEPYGEMTPEQKTEAERLVYDAIMVSAIKGIGVVSNGKQTGSIFDGYLRRHDANNTAISAISRGLRRWGHEGRVGDRYNTPRIAGMVCIPGNDVALGIITAGNEESEFLAAGHYPLKGVAGLLSTYTGESDEPRAPEFRHIRDAVKELRIEGRTAQELAKEMYGSMDPDFAVASAAAMWVPLNKKWQLAVKNKN